MTSLAPPTKEPEPGLIPVQSEPSTFPEPREVPAEMKLSTAQDLIKPTSQPPSPGLPGVPGPPASINSSSSDVVHVDSPTVIKHPYTDTFPDSGSSAPSSPTPEKSHARKMKKKKKHSSKNASGSKALKSRGGAYMGMASPLTNQIGPLPAGGQTPSMSQLVSEISVSNTNNGSEGGSRSAVTSGRVTSAQIDTEMMQIDSILRALNMGTFDDGNMATIQQLIKQRPQVRTPVYVGCKRGGNQSILPILPQNVLSSVPQPKSLGLALISQLGSDEEDSSSSDSGLSSSDDDEEEDMKEVAEEEEEE